MSIQVIQEIITYIIVAAAVYVAGYKIITALTARGESKSACGDCSGCSSVDIEKKHRNSQVTQH